MGKKERVMIACTTTETYRISDAVTYFDVDRVHLIHYILESNPMNWFYKDFYDRTVDLIQQSIPDIEIVEHSSKVFVFDEMFKEIESIVESESERDVEPIVYINLSAGSPEYISAATMISMMHENTEPISVGASEYLHSSEDDIRSIYYVDGIPVGLIKTTKEPKMMQQFKLSAPNRRLVIGLRILDDRINGDLPVTSKYMVEDFKNAGIWERSSNSNEQVYYNRDFIDKWLSNGWVCRHPDIHKKLIVTEFGHFILNTFYTKLTFIQN